MERRGANTRSRLSGVAEPPIVAFPWLGRNQGTIARDSHDWIAPFRQVFAPDDRHGLKSIEFLTDDDRFGPSIPYFRVLMQRLKGRGYGLWGHMLRACACVVAEWRLRCHQPSPCCVTCPPRYVEGKTLAGFPYDFRLGATHEPTLQSLGRRIRALHAAAG